jgi:hypothetical protein
MSDDTNDQPTPGTKAALEAELASAKQELELMRGQLAAAGADRPDKAAAGKHVFFLSEGVRQELEMFGVANVDGQLMTADAVRARLTGDQEGVEIKEAAPELARQAPEVLVRPGVPGVDFVYPSVARGEIDPAVAGRPGINGPAAGDRGAIDAPDARK